MVVVTVKDTPTVKARVVRARLFSMKLYMNRLLEYTTNTYQTMLCCVPGFVTCNRYDKDFDTATPPLKNWWVMLPLEAIWVDVVGDKAVMLKFES